MNKIINNFKNDKNTAALLIIGIAIFAIMSIIAPNSFLGLSNLQSMAVQFPEYGVLSFGMMLCMISGGIDLSLVGIANLSGVIATLIIVGNHGSLFGIILGIAMAFIVGAACGLINGFFIGYLQIPPMLVTLCGLQLYTGIGLAITKGPALTGLPESFSLIANGTIAYIPIPLIIFIVVAIVINYILNATIFGREVSYLGTNSIASKYTGINNLVVTLKTYMISGVLGTISGIIMISHYNSAKADYGSTYTLLSLLIVVLGGTAPEGGKGKVIGVTLSIIVLQLVSSAFNILRVNAYIKTFVWGIILLMVMLFIHASRKKNK